jgi:hypothetical protein
MQIGLDENNLIQAKLMEDETKDSAIIAVHKWDLQITFTFIHCSCSKANLVMKKLPIYS